MLIINGGTKLLNYSVAEAFRRAGRSRYPVAYASLEGRHEAVFYTLPDDPGGTVETADGPLDLRTSIRNSPT